MPEALSDIADDLRAISVWHDSENPSRMVLGALASRALNFINEQSAELDRLQHIEADYLRRHKDAVDRYEEIQRLHKALAKSASTLQDLAASCRAYGHNAAAGAAEACEQYVREALKRQEPPKEPNGALE